MILRGLRGLAAGLLVGVLGGCGTSDDSVALRGISSPQRISMAVSESLPAPDEDLASEGITLPEAERLADWPQAGGGVGGFVHVDAGGAFEIAWSTRLSRASSKAPIASPAVVWGGLIFVLDGKKTVHAVDTRGQRVWQRSLSALEGDSTHGIGGAVSVAEGKVIVSPGYRYVVALDAETGREVWRRPTGSPMIGSAAIRDRRIYVTSSNNEIYALDLESGEVIWSDQGIAETARVLAAPSSAISDQVLITPYSSGELVAYLPVNGRRVWTDSLTVSGRFSPASTLSDIAARPAVVEDAVYAVSQSGVLAAIDVRNGARRWVRDVRSVGAPVIAGRYLFLVTTDARVICFHRRDGRVVWVRQLRGKRDKGTKRTRRKNINWSGPVLASGRLVVVSSDGIALGLSPQSGETVSSLDLVHSVSVEPVAAGEHLYFVSADSRLIAVR